jgi:hypothetical protein
MNEEDMNNSSDAAIVSVLVAKRLWPGESAIGKPVCVFCSPEQPNNWKRVVGVVSSSRHASMDGSQQQASVYLATGALQKAVFLVVRSDRPDSDLQKVIREVIAGIDPNQPVFFSARMQTLIDDSLADRRFVMLLLALTGCLALAMAAAHLHLQALREFPTDFFVERSTLGCAELTATFNLSDAGLALALKSRPFW